MPAGLVQLAESLSAYRNLYQPHDRDYARNPVAYSHYLADVAGHSVSVLSRVTAYGTDYSGRTNKLAHHFVLRNADRTAAGPASVMSHEALFIREWKEEPRLLSARARLRVEDVPSFRAGAWEALCGDAGWAGVLAQRHYDAPGRDTYLVFEPGMDVLALVREALALLPPGERWKVTFSTYFASAPRHSTCHWRACVKDADVLRTARGKKGVLAIDLTADMPPAGETPLVAVARGEATPEWAQPPEPAPPPRRRKPVRKRKVSELIATPRPEPGSVALRAAEPLEKQPLEVGRGSRAKVTAAARVEPKKPLFGVGEAVGVAVGVIVIVIACVWIGRMGCSKRRARTGTPTVQRPASPRKAPVPEPRPAVPVAVPVVEEREPTATVAAVDVEDPAVTDVAPAVNPADTKRPVNVEFRTKTFTAVSPPWRIALAGGEPWMTYDYEFVGSDGSVLGDDPVRDVDRLRNTVRALTYKLNLAGLQAKVTNTGMDFDRSGSATPRTERLACVRVSRPERDSDVVFWLNGAKAVGRVVDRAGPVFSVANEGAVALLSPLLAKGALRCQGSFEGTSLQCDLPYEAFTDGNAVVIRVVVDDAERERIVNVIRWQAREKNETPAAPRAPRQAPVWDYRRIEKTLRKLRDEVGETGMLTSVRRTRVVRELRGLLVDVCETRLQGRWSNLPAAPDANKAMEAMRAVVLSALQDNDAFPGMETEDFMPSRTVTSPTVIRAIAVERARFFREQLVPSNRLLNGDRLRAIVLADEWDALLATADATDSSRNEAKQTPDEAIELVVSALFFYATDAAYEPVLTVRRAGVEAF